MISTIFKTVIMTCLIPSFAMASNFSINLNLSGDNCADPASCYASDSIDMSTKFSVKHKALQAQLNGNAVFSGQDEMGNLADMHVAYSSFASANAGKGVQLSANVTVDNPIYNVANPPFSFSGEYGELLNDPQGIPSRLMMGLLIAYFDQVQVVADEPVSTVEITLHARASLGGQPDEFSTGLVAYGKSSLSNHFQVFSETSGTILNTSEVVVFEVENNSINISLDWLNYFRISLNNNSEFILQNFYHNIEFGNIRGVNAAGDEVAVTLTGARGNVY